MHYSCSCATVVFRHGSRDSRVETDRVRVPVAALKKLRRLMGAPAGKVRQLARQPEVGLPGQQVK